MNPMKKYEKHFFLQLLLNPLNLGLITIQSFPNSPSPPLQPYNTKVHNQQNYDPQQPAGSGPRGMTNSTI